MRVVKHWHRLAREVGDAPSLETFKVRLDGALSKLLLLLMEGGLDQMAFKGLFQPYDSVILQPAKPISHTLPGWGSGGVSMADAPILPHQHRESGPQK